MTEDSVRHEVSDFSLFITHHHTYFALAYIYNTYTTHIPQVFLLCPKTNDSQIVKSIAAAQKLFSSVYVIGTTHFDKCFSFHVIAGRRCF